MSPATKSARSIPGTQFWIKHVQSYRKSQLSQSQYCRENKLKLSTFRYWDRKLHPDTSQVTTSKDGSQSRSGFIDVTHILTNQNPAQTNFFLEIEIGKDYKIRIPPGYEIEHLRKILILIKELVCISI